MVGVRGGSERGKRVRDGWGFRFQVSRVFGSEAAGSLVWGGAVEEHDSTASTRPF